MPYDDPDPTDPMMLHGVMFETDDDRAMGDMADCFVEEYLRLGFTPDRILRMFKNSAFAGPHLAYQSLGDQAIQERIERQHRRRAPARHPSIEAVRSPGDLSLVVLN